MQEGTNANHLVLQGQRTSYAHLTIADEAIVFIAITIIPESSRDRIGIDYTFLKNNLSLKSLHLIMKTTANESHAWKAKA
jgi:hypothetical protein